MADTTEVLAPLAPEELRKIDAYRRACNYLSAGMIHLLCWFSLKWREGVFR